MFSLASSCLSEQGCGPPDNSELLSLKLTTRDSPVCGEEADYVLQGTSEMTAAQESEEAGDHSTAVKRYRTAVEILMKGLQGEEEKEAKEIPGVREKPCFRNGGLKQFKVNVTMQKTLCSDYSECRLWKK